MINTKNIDFFCMLCHTVRVGYSRGLKEQKGEAAQGLAGEHPLPRPAQLFAQRGYVAAIHQIRRLHGVSFLLVGS